MASLHTKIFFFFFFFWVNVGVTQATKYDDLASNVTEYDGLSSLTCMQDGMASSTSKHNLDSALQNLTSLSSFTRYALSTIGSGEDQVHAMFQCRGDQSTQGCMQCLAKTITLLHSECPFSVAVSIQMDACYLRYDNHTFTMPDFHFEGASWTTRSVNDPVSLQAIMYVLDTAISLAPRYGGYAVARGRNDYVAIAQCLGYLSQTECAQCLSKAAYNATSAFNVSDTEYAQVYLTGCYYRHENRDFLTASSKATPAPQLLPAVPTGPLQRKFLDLPLI